MKRIMILSITALALSGCGLAMKQASFSDGLADKFSEPDKIPPNQAKCIKLKTDYSFSSGVNRVTFPAGIYRGKEKRASGIYFYSPKPLTVKVLLTQQMVGGIFLTNAKDKAFLFTVYDGISRREVTRGLQLPNSALKLILSDSSCR